MRVIEDLNSSGDATIHVVQKNHFFKISSNSEASASELLENLEEMFPRYTKHVVGHVVHLYELTSTVD